LLETLSRPQCCRSPAHRLSPYLGFDTYGGEPLPPIEAGREAKRLGAAGRRPAAGHTGLAGCSGWAVAGCGGGAAGSGARMAGCGADPARNGGCSGGWSPAGRSRAHPCWATGRHPGACGSGGSGGGQRRWGGAHPPGTSKRAPFDAIRPAAGAGGGRGRWSSKGHLMTHTTPPSRPPRVPSPRGTGIAPASHAALRPAPCDRLTAPRGSHALAQ